MSKHEAKEKKTSSASSGNNDHAAQESSLKIEENTRDEESTLEDQLAEMNDKYLRLYSEFENYRKRTLKEKIELSKMAASELIIKLLPVLDDFERAINAIEPDTDPTGANKEGISLIYNKFLSTLNQEGLEQMVSVGEKFDTDFHEAVTNIPAPAPEQKNTILDEVLKGYLLNGKVIRYAKVIVGN